MRYENTNYMDGTTIRNYSNLAAFDNCHANGNALNRMSWSMISLPRRKGQSTLSCPNDVYQMLRDIGQLDREVFYCLHLNTRHNLISCEEVSKGTLDASLVHPREVYKSAIIQSASAIIISHNHPSGDPSPSDDDVEITTRLSRVGELVGIRVLDHVIIGDNTYSSMKELGVFD